MTLNDVKKFANDISRNPKLQASVNAAATPADVVALGKKQGYSFSETDLRSFDQHLDEMSRSISKADLAKIAGGYAIEPVDLGFKLTNKKTCGTPCCSIGGTI